MGVNTIKAGTTTNFWVKVPDCSKGMLMLRVLTPTALGDLVSHLKVSFLEPIEQKIL